MDACADQGHLQIEGVQKGIPINRGHAAALSPKLGALAQQTAVTAHQIGVDRLKLQHHPIQPLAPEGWLAPHQVKVQSAEAHTAQRTDQIDLPIQGFAIAFGLAPTSTAQLQLQIVSITGVGPQPGLRSIPVDQILVLADTVRAQTPQQFDRLEQIRFANTVAANHQQARCLNLQLQMAVVAEPLQFQLEKPNRSGCGVSLRYLHRSDPRVDSMQRR